MCECERACGLNYHTSSIYSCVFVLEDTRRFSSGFHFMRAAEISPLKGDSQAPSLDIPTTSQPMKAEQVFNEIFK